MSGGIATGNRVTQVGDAIFTVSGGLRRYPAGGCGAATCNPTWTTQPTGVGAINDLAGEPSGPLFALAAGPAFDQISLFTIDPVTGAAVGDPIFPGFNATALALAHGKVFIAGGTGVGGNGVAAYDAASCAAGHCALVWSATVGAQVTFANGLAVAGGVVYVGRQDGVVEAFAESGCA